MDAHYVCLVIEKPTHMGELKCTGIEKKNMSQIKPRGLYVLIKLDTESEDEKALKKLGMQGLRDFKLKDKVVHTGEVLGIGDGYYKNNKGDQGRWTFLVQKGDKVAFPRYDGYEVKHEGEDYFLIQETGILGIYAF